MSKIISREDVLNMNIDEYTEILKIESHHKHDIEMVNGVLRWKQDEIIRDYINKNSLNDLVIFLHSIGITKNSEEYRKMYRGMGYSLSGYWEIFYWDMNNEECDEYRKGLTNE